MTTYTFGTSVNPAHYLEVQDTSYVDPLGLGRTLMVRPPAGTTIKVRNDADHTALPDQTSAANGYFSFTTDNVPVVDVSANNGVLWIPLIGIEVEVGLASLSQNDSQALVVAQSAVDTVNGLQALGGQPGGWATLDSNGTLQLSQAAGMYPIMQNSDGSWPNRPATPLCCIWIQTVGGSSGPAKGGTIAGGPGMAPVDFEVDISLTLGA